MITEFVDPPARNAPDLLPRSESVHLLRVQLEQGLAVKGQRIRTASELEKAREQKLDWTHKTVALLERIFGNRSFAVDEFTWVGPILPEFSNLKQFVDQFNEEMDHRLRSLHRLLKQVTADAEAARETAFTMKASDRVEDRMMKQMAAEPEAAWETAAAGTSSDRVETLEPGAVKEIRMPAEVIPQQRGPEGHQPLPKKEHVQAPHAAPRSPGSAHEHRLRGCILIVHERNEMLESAISQFVARLGFEPMPLYDHAEEGGGTIDRLARHTNAAFAIILATSADVTAARQPTDEPVDPANRRAIFELGYCVGKLGAERVCVLHGVQASFFKDECGILYVPVDAAEGWQLQLARQLRRSGVEVDLNRLC